MLSGATSGSDAVGRIADVMFSPMLDVLVGITGIVLPVVAWASHRMATADILLAAGTALVLFLVASQPGRFRRAHVFLPRPVSRHMSDPGYFDLVRSRLEPGLFADFGEIADGHVQAYAADVSHLVILLVQTLTDSAVLLPG